MKSVGPLLCAVTPVDPGENPTIGTHRAKRAAAPKRNIFPVVHTPYDYYEGIFK